MGYKIMNKYIIVVINDKSVVFINEYDKRVAKLKVKLHKKAIVVHGHEIVGYNGLSYTEAMERASSLMSYINNYVK